MTNGLLLLYENYRSQPIEPISRSGRVIGVVGVVVMVRILFLRKISTNQLTDRPANERTDTPYKVVYLQLKSCTVSFVKKL